MDVTAEIATKTPFAIYGCKKCFPIIKITPSKMFWIVLHSETLAILGLMKL